MLIGNRLEILPGHRGKGLTKVIFNEFVRLFGASCSLLVIKSFPLQGEAGFKDYLENGSLNDWQKSLCLADLESDMATATERLSDSTNSMMTW